MRVKQFDGVSIDEKINQWLEQNEPDVEIIDIKYALVSDGVDSQGFLRPHFRSALVIYKKGRE